MDKMIEKLNEFIEIEGSEWSEYMQLVISLYESSLCHGKIKKTLEDEIKRQYKIMTKNYKIVEEVTMVKQIDRHIEYIDE